MNGAKRLVYEHELDFYELDSNYTYDEMSCYYSDYYIDFDLDNLKLELFITYEN